MFTYIKYVTVFSLFLNLVESAKEKYKGEPRNWRFLLYCWTSNYYDAMFTLNFFKV